MSEIARDYLVLPCAAGAGSAMDCIRLHVTTLLQLVCAAVGQAGAIEGPQCACKARRGWQKRSHAACYVCLSVSAPKLSHDSQSDRENRMLLSKAFALARCAALWRIWVSTLQ